MEKIAIIGFGAATIGFLKGLEDFGKINDLDMHIFERGRDAIDCSLSGIRSDGKLFISKDMGGDLDADESLQKKIVDYYLEFIDTEPEIGKSFYNEERMKEFSESGFLPVRSFFFHIGSENLGKMVKDIYDHFSRYENITFHFNHKITDILNGDGRIRLQDENGIIDHEFRRAIVAVGRSGYHLTRRMISKKPQMVLNNTLVDLGVRIEVPNKIVQDLNDEMYEFKIKCMGSMGYQVRTFCNNPGGSLSLEDYDGLATINGHSEQKMKTQNTNIAILVTHKFTEPFNDPFTYGKNIAELANLLAGGKKVITQKYGDFKRGKRTKSLGKVKPTLKDDEYILGDLNLVLPGKTIKSVIEFIDKLGNCIKGFDSEDNLITGVEVKFYSNKLDNDYYDNLKFIGDCSGWTRSITYSTVHGYMTATDF